MKNAKAIATLVACLATATTGALTVRNATLEERVAKLEAKYRVLDGTAFELTEISQRALVLAMMSVVSLNVREFSEAFEAATDGAATLLRRGSIDALTGLIRYQVLRGMWDGMGPGNDFDATTKRRIENGLIALRDAVDKKQAKEEDAASKAERKEGK